MLTCQDEVKTPFSMVVPKQGPAQVVSSTRIQRAEKDTLCGGLSLNIGGRPQGPGKVAMHLPITNDSPHLWRGTVKLLLDETPIPVDIGEIDAGETESDTVVVRLDPGSHQVDGSLLIGP